MQLIFQTSHHLGTAGILRCSENRSAGVSPAGAGASRCRARAGCPCHRGRDARATSVHRRAIFMVSGRPPANGHERLPEISAPARHTASSACKRSRRIMRRTIIPVSHLNDLRLKSIASQGKFTVEEKNVGHLQNHGVGWNLTQ